MNGHSWAAPFGMVRMSRTRTSWLERYCTIFVEHLTRVTPGAGSSFCLTAPAFDGYCATLRSGCEVLAKIGSVVALVSSRSVDIEHDWRCLKQKKCADNWNSFLLRMPFSSPMTQLRPIRI